MNQRENVIYLWRIFSPELAKKFSYLFSVMANFFDRGLRSIF